MSAAQDVRATTMEDLLEWANSARFSGSVVVRASRAGTIHFTNGFVSLVSVEGQPEGLGDNSDNREIRLRLARRLALLLHGYSGDVTVDEGSRIPSEARLLFVGANLLEIALAQDAPPPTVEANPEPEPAAAAATELRSAVKAPRLRTGLHQYTSMTLTPRTTGSGPIYCGTDAWALVVALCSEAIPADVAKQLGWDSHRLIAAINDLRYQGVLDAKVDRDDPANAGEHRIDLPGPPPLQAAPSPVDGNADSASAVAPAAAAVPPRVAPSTPAIASTKPQSGPAAPAPRTPAAPAAAAPTTRAVGPEDVPPATAPPAAARSITPPLPHPEAPAGPAKVDRPIVSTALPRGANRPGAPAGPTPPASLPPLPSSGPSPLPPVPPAPAARAAAPSVVSVDPWPTVERRAPTEAATVVPSVPPAPGIVPGPDGSPSSVPPAEASPTERRGQAKRTRASALRRLIRNLQ